MDASGGEAAVEKKWVLRDMRDRMERAIGDFPRKKKKGKQINYWPQIQCFSAYESNGYARIFVMHNNVVPQNLASLIHGNSSAQLPAVFPRFNVSENCIQNKPSSSTSIRKLQIILQPPSVESCCGIQPKIHASHLGELRESQRL